RVPLRNVPFRDASRGRHMNEQVRLSRLIAGIYDAALEAGRWPEALARVVDFVGGHGGGLLAKEPGSRDIATRWQAGVAPHYMQLYADTYSKLGPVSALSSGDVGQIVSVPDVVPYRDFRRSRFFREWAQPQGWVDVAIALIDKSADRWTYLSVSRNTLDGMVDDEMRRRIALTLPHIRRALRVGKSLERGQADAAAFSDVLNYLSAGLFLLDAQGRIVHTNAAADGMLSDGGLLRAIGGRLVAGIA